MLKALELIGFKSFADRTRFEFPRGITVVVGPNGSGKSNIVDAIKWVLGEQSVKSLRGKEMVDCIFNGSSTRKALNSAETTLTFDNADRRLPLDTPEVHITRRVYRSGEGEYLINRQPCRLRDIRDLFAGTGVATEAYSIIEQGKVDVMLQSSAKERRAIFEEASGISRFKAKKIEALRRLERVEQNLLRLSDIVDEVESRLRSVRNQATKAKRYKEHADRLQQLRTHVGLVDYRAFGEKLAAIEGESATIRQSIATETAAASAAEAQAANLEAETAKFDSQIHAAEARLSENRERTASLETTIELERTRVVESEEQAARHRKQFLALSNRAVDLAGLSETTRAELQVAEVKHQQLSNALADQQRALTALTAQLDQIRNENEQRRATHLEQLRSSAALTNEISALEGRLSRTEETRERSAQRLADLQSTRQRAEQELAALLERQREVNERLEERARELTAARNSLVDARRQHAALQKDLAGWREKLSGANERAALLEELEKRHEGVGDGVKEVLQFSQENPAGPFEQVRGMLADLIQVSVETAPIIEAALGEKAQHIVVTPGKRLFEYFAHHGKRLSSRVGILTLDESEPQIADSDLSDQLGVIGRADRFVECSPELTPMIRRLLGRTWIIENLTHAIVIADQTDNGLNFVTLAGDFLAADGTLTVGQRQASTGLISRRSELRALRSQIGRWQKTVDDMAELVAALDQQVGVREHNVSVAATAHQSASEQVAEQRLRVLTATQLGEQLAEQQRNRDALSAQVELARSEQQLDHLRGQVRRFEQDQQERQRSIEESREHLADATRRATQAELRILAAEAESAEGYLHKELLAAEVAQLAEQREAFRARRFECTQAIGKHRAKTRKLEEQLHAKDLTASEILHERTTLENRLREDYGIELSAASESLSPDEQQAREQLEAEIADLRKKLTNIGGVNLEALEEVDQLEQRYQSLSTQFQDLSQAKGSLEQIIQRINADSRRLFAETLETVKGHFQQLFRKLFGGGQADIVLEPEVDILESGIEIVARPPGKEPRSISLLSGGEKTLTCVALLLAIFRSRPSPFCVLDEVDAALDEANIERFVNVLKEFLEWTQFVVVTHSKKTMAFANSLYGVTMQESGISKRVSVRFDDVSETGEISRAAVEREEKEAGATEAA